MPPDARATFDRLIALCEPVRRDLYFYVAGRDGWASRDEAAEALGVRRGLAAHHLDRLADDGLLEVQYRRLTGRSGPGAGRPAKLYRRAEGYFEFTIPQRNPALVADLLADAIGRAGAAADSVRTELFSAAREAGNDTGRRARGGRLLVDRRTSLTTLLGGLGYSPQAVGGELTLANCPYEPQAGRARELVCSMNLAFIEGVLSGVGLRGTRCSLRPPEVAGCCVRVAPWPGDGDGGGR